MPVDAMKHRVVCCKQMWVEIRVVLPVVPRVHEAYSDNICYRVMHCVHGPSVWQRVAGCASGIPAPVTSA